MEPVTQAEIATARVGQWAHVTPLGVVDGTDFVRRLTIELERLRAERGR